MSAALAIRKTLVDELPALMPRESAKVIAFKVGTTPRCIHGLRQGEHVPRLDVALALAREYPPIRKMFVHLMDAETGESGEDPAQVFAQIVRLAQRQLD